VYIEGKIRTSTYQDKDGVTRYDKRIRATNMTFVGGRNEGNDTQAPSAPPSSQRNDEPLTNPANDTPVASSTHEADDLPF
jgi:single-strand DNA-binding protein